MFSIGDKVVIDMDVERYRECMCDYCELLRDGGFGLVIDVQLNHDPIGNILVVRITDKHGRVHDEFAYYENGVKLLGDSNHIWEV